MNRLFSLRTAALLSTVTLIAGWQLSVSGQGIKSVSVAAGGSADSGEIAGIETAFAPGDPAEPTYARSLLADIDPAYAPKEDAAILVPLHPVWETDFSKLRTILSTKPESLNPQQLQILDDGLKNRTESLMEQHAEATDEARRKELESELAEVVAQHFKVRQAIRDRAIARLEQQVARLRDLLQQREDARQQIVQGRIDQLIRSAKGLGWDGERDQAPSAAPAIPGAPRRMPSADSAPSRR